MNVYRLVLINLILWKQNIKYFFKITMKKIKASVIIPYYKKKKTIKQAVKSVILQTYKNLEIILIYDDEDKSDLKFLKI